MPNTPTSAAMAPTVVANRDTLNYSTTSLETEPDRLQAEVGQAEEGSQIRTTEGSVEHIEALGMDGVGTSIIEGLDPCLQPHHPPFTGMSQKTLQTVLLENIYTMRNSLSMNMTHTLYIE